MLQFEEYKVKLNNLKPALEELRGNLGLEQAAREVEELVLELQEKYTIVIVTHNMQQAARISDYTAFFYKGRIIEFDRTEKVFTNPSNPHTESYITGRFG